MIHFRFLFDFSFLNSKKRGRVLSLTISQNFLKSLELTKMKLKWKKFLEKGENRGWLMIILGFVKYVSPQKKREENNHRLLPTPDWIRIRISLSLFLIFQENSSLGHDERKERERERKFSWISFIKKISAILKNVHYVGLNEKIPSHLQSEENIKVSSMFSNIGEWFFELYIEIQSCSRVKEEGKRGGGGKVRNRATYRRFSIASKTTTILVNPIKWLCAIA